MLLTVLWEIWIVLWPVNTDMTVSYRLQALRSQSRWNPISLTLGPHHYALETHSGHKFEVMDRTVRCTQRLIYNAGRQVAPMDLTLLTNLPYLTSTLQFWSKVSVLPFLQHECSTKEARSSRERSLPVFIEDAKETLHSFQSSFVDRVFVDFQERLRQSYQKKKGSGTC